MLFSFLQMPSTPALVDISICHQASAVIPNSLISSPAMLLQQSMGQMAVLQLLERYTLLTESK